MSIDKLVKFVNEMEDWLYLQVILTTRFDETAIYFRKSHVPKKAKNTDFLDRANLLFNKIIL